VGHRNRPSLLDVQGRQTVRHCWKSELAVETEGPALKEPGHNCWLELAVVGFGYMIVVGVVELELDNFVAEVGCNCSAVVELVV